MQLLVLLFIALVISITGEICCKNASLNAGVKMYIYMGGCAIIWGILSPVVWVQIYKLKTINEILVLYNPVHLMILAGTGVLVFNEPFTWRMALTLVLLCVCFILQK